VYIFISDYSLTSWLRRPLLTVSGGIILNGFMISCRWPVSPPKWNSRDFQLRLSVSALPETYRIIQKEDESLTCVSLNAHHPGNRPRFDANLGQFLSSSEQALAHPAEAAYCHTYVHLWTTTPSVKSFQPHLIWAIGRLGSRRKPEGICFNLEYSAAMNTRTTGPHVNVNDVIT